jgi:hypothetical protein
MDTTMTTVLTILDPSLFTSSILVDGRIVAISRVLPETAAPPDASDSGSGDSCHKGEELEVLVKHATQVHRAVVDDIREEGGGFPASLGVGSHKLAFQ